MIRSMKKSVWNKTNDICGHWFTFLFKSVHYKSDSVAAASAKYFIGNQNLLFSTL